MASDETARELRKIANLLALKQIEGMGKGEQARVLSAAGYSTAEIAAFTGSTEGSIRAMLSERRRKVAAEE
jgi:DNA-directed RNA polymerase specialized sigma24 family protein